MTRRMGTVAAVLAIALAVALPFSVGSYNEGLAVTAGTFLILAISWNLMGGLCGLFSFGHAAFFGIGAYASGLMLLHTDLPLPVVLAGSAAAAAIASLVVMVCFRTQGVYFAIITLALAETLRLVAKQVFPGGQSGLFFDPPFAVDSHAPYWYVLALVLLGLALSVAIRRSSLGQALAAVRSDPDAAESVGVSATRTRAFTTLISAALVGTAGGMYAVTQTFIDPDTVFNVQYSLVPVLMVTLGGMGTIAGPVVGAIGWSILDELMRRSSDGGAATSVIVYGLVLVILAVLMPAGIVGKGRELAGRPRRSVRVARRHAEEPA